MDLQSGESHELREAALCLGSPWRSVPRRIKAPALSQGPRLLLRPVATSVWGHATVSSHGTEQSEAVGEAPFTGSAWLIVTTCCDRQHQLQELSTCPHPALECPFFQPSPASQQMTHQENALVQEAPLSPGSDWSGGLIARDDISHVEGHSKGRVRVLENVSVLVELNCLHLHPDHIKHISNKVQAKPSVVGCVCMCVCSVTSLCSPVDCSRPGTSVHGILHTRVLECLVISFPRGPSWPRNWTHVSCISCIGRRMLLHWCHLVLVSCFLKQLMQQHHWSLITDHHNKDNTAEKVWKIARYTKMWCRDMKWAGAVGNVQPRDSLDTVATNLQFVNNAVSVKHNGDKACVH